jgi:hypothetical protein
MNSTNEILLIVSIIIFLLFGKVLKKVFVILVIQSLTVFYVFLFVLKPIKTEYLNIDNEINLATYANSYSSNYYSKNFLFGFLFIMLFIIGDKIYFRLNEAK